MLKKININLEILYAPWLVVELFIYLHTNWSQLSSPFMSVKSFQLRACVMSLFSEKP